MSAAPHGRLMWCHHCGLLLPPLPLQRLSICPGKCHQTTKLSVQSQNRPRVGIRPLHEVILNSTRVFGAAGPQHSGFISDVFNKQRLASCTCVLAPDGDARCVCVQVQALTVCTAE